jgi:hypothetical protein
VVGSPKIRPPSATDIAPLDSYLKPLSPKKTLKRSSRGSPKNPKVKSLKSVPMNFS